MFTLSPIHPQLALQLRQQILRPHQSLEECVYSGDEDPASGHYGAFFGKELVGIASIYRQPPEGVEDVGAWRVRGMAVAEDMQGRGAGALLLQACGRHARFKGGTWVWCGRHARFKGGTWVWCNARTSAMGFYSKLGFNAVGEAFELPGIGQHYVMKRHLSRLTLGD